MLAERPARAVRVGGVTVGAGEARAVAIPLTARARAKNGAGAEDAARSIPAWVVVGTKAGPRVGVVAAVRGVERAAARAAARLAASLDPSALSGSVVIIPVLRPFGRLARPGKAAAPAWEFPGAAGGRRAERDAFAVFSDVVVGAQALFTVSAPARGRRGVVVARGPLSDPRVRRLAVASGAAAIRPVVPARGGLMASAGATGVPAVELAAADGTDGADEAPAAEALAAALRACLEALAMVAAAPAHGAAGAGVNGAGANGEPLAPKPATRAEEPLLADRAVLVRAEADGMLEAPLAPGTPVRSRALLGRIAPLLPGPSRPVPAPIDGLILEAAPAGPVRRGGVLFALAALSRTTLRRRAAHAAQQGAGMATATAATPRGAAATADKTRVGWVEYVALPGLGVERLKAKIDTGARTSALHVARMKTVDTAGGPHRRPILEITVPSGRRGKRPQVVRAAVRAFAMVRDTSGRTERRPVIETALRLGPIERRIAVTLTNRGDMLFPMLIGRTALGPGIVVDPAQRYLLGRSIS